MHPMFSPLHFLNLLHIFNDGYQASFLLLLPFIAKDLHISLTQIGQLGSFIYFFETILALPTGYLGEKISPFKLIIAAMCLYGISYLFIYFVHSYLFLIFLFILAGIGFALFHPLGFALAASLSPKNSIGKNVGDFTAIGDLGRISLSTAVTFLAVNIGWRNTSLLYSFLIFIFIFIFLRVIRKKIIHNKMVVEGKLNTKSVKFSQLLKNRKFILSSLTALFDSAASSSLFIFLPFLLIKKGVNPAVLGTFTAAYFVGNFLGKSVIGRLTDKWGGVTVFVIAELCMAIFIIVLTQTSSLWLIIIISIILGTLTKGTIPARATMAIESVAHHGRYEKAVALLGFIASIGTTSAPMIYGKIADSWGISYTFYLSAILAIVAIIPALGYRFTKSE